MAIECKWKITERDFETRNIRAFLRQYPNSKVYMVSPEVKHTYYKKLDALINEAVK